MDSGFVDRLCQAVVHRRTPVLVGLDPRWEQLPSVFHRTFDGKARADRARAIGDFCRGVIDVVAPLVPAVKPQVAFFEQLGPEGMTVLAKLVDYASEKELLVVVDAKRSDIGSTAAAYADAYLGSRGASVWGGDALTVSPYLGDDSLAPFVEVAVMRNAGLFVLVKTSNPGGKTFQDLKIEGNPLYFYVAALVENFANQTIGQCGYGNVGAVVGATYPEQLIDLRDLMPHTWFLVPGYGAQGAGAIDVAGAFDSRGLGAIINSSRGIIFAHARQPYDEIFGDERWQEAVEAATLEMIQQLADATPAGQL